MSGGSASSWHVLDPFQFFVRELVSLGGAVGKP